MGSLSVPMENWQQDYPALNTDPSGADHLKMIEHLRQIRAGPVVEELDITKLPPWDLRRCFPLLSKHLLGTRAKEWETQHGPWKFKTGSFSVVLGGHDMLSVGAKRTMEFYQNGTATDWAMDQYFGLARMMGRLVMEDDVTLCHVYQQKRKGPLTEREYSAPMENLGGNFAIEGYDVDALLACLPPSFHENRTNQNHQAANNQEAAVLPKPKRKSDVWNDFTEIYVKDLDGKLKQEYAMCNFCHMLLIAPSSHGTNTLWKHTGSCRCKRQTQ
ncbi:NAC domain-containing protein 22-like [Lolium rigidum]|uniref:NAC domain-containing protein 22-like n=1 Tax=Lolium rigidum TaxID=89674 RepID=UPI001F5DC487|nr:NAC domain-containing protein 22-like [Lolium rigidum]